MIRLMKNRTILKKMTKEDHCYVDASPADRVSLIWEITSEIWFLYNKKDVERRLQRDITHIIRQQG